MRPGEYLNLTRDSVRRKVSGMGQKDWRFLRELLHVAASRGTKFLVDLKSLSLNINELNISTFLTGEELRPPFPVTVIEFEGCEDLEIGDTRRTPDMLIVLDKETEVRIYVFCIQEEKSGSHVMAAMPTYVAIPYNSDALFNPVTVTIKTDDLDARVFLPNKCKLATEKFGAEFMDKAGAGSSSFIAFYIAFCAALMRAGAELTDRTPDPAANRSRRARGLTPLYTYKVLTINPNKPVSNAKGTGHGSHASPRTHLRRGYYRTSKNGVRHWVKSTVVKGEAGFVHKDYRISTETTGAHYNA